MPAIFLEERLWKLSFLPVNHFQLSTGKHQGAHLKITIKDFDSKITFKFPILALFQKPGDKLAQMKQGIFHDHKY